MLAELIGSFLPFFADLLEEALVDVDDSRSAIELRDRPRG